MHTLHSAPPGAGISLILAVECTGVARRFSTKNFVKFAGAFALMSFFAALLLLSQFVPASAQQQLPATDQDSRSAAEPVPAFHAQPPTGDLPSTINPSVFTDKLVFNAYAVAGRVKKVLYQQPCYCHCDRAAGHGSLLDCYVGQHGTRCDICQKEVFYSYEQTRAGKTPMQIRQGIIRGDWRQVDLAKYQQAYLPLSTTPAK
jgi:Protein of unknown function with PCYCGC motif